MEYFEGLDPTGDLRETYVGRVADRLVAGDDRLESTRDTWAAFVRETTGDSLPDSEIEVSAAGAGLDPLDSAFVTTCYYDFLVEAIIDSIEGITDTEIANRSPTANTTAPDIGFGELHDDVLAPSEGRLRVRDALAADTLRERGPDALGELYRAVVPRTVRLALGEYYTPRGIADLAVAALDEDLSDQRVLDPGCGAGAFLTAAIDAKRSAIDADPDRAVDRLLDSVVGIDLNPVAVKSAKGAYLLALSDLLAESDRSSVSIPVFLTDALGLTREDELRIAGEPLDTSFDALVGNPPWIPWERLPTAIKDAWRTEYVTELGLQPHDGVEARLGHSNDDVSVPYAFTCIHRYLRQGGVAAFVLKRDIVRGPAGAVFRRLQVGDRSLDVTAVHDLAALDPFADASADAAVYAFRADAPSSLPVPATVWHRPDGETVSVAAGDRLHETATTVGTELVPIDESDRTTAWVRADLAREALGDCVHEIRHGLKDDAAAVFGIDRATLDRLEPDRVYPYLRSRHVREYGLTGHDLRLVPADGAGADNEERLRAEYPETYAYLDEHRETLCDRSSSWLDDGPFYTQFGLGPYTWAPYKLVWCRLGFKPDFAVASTRTDPDLGEKTVVPGDHYMFIATDDRREAHFLCALLNSAPYQRTLRTLASGGKASLSKSVVSELALPAWPGTERAERLAACSIELHDLVATRPDDGDGDSDSSGDAERTARVETLRERVDRLVRTGIEAGEFGVDSGVDR